MQRSELEHVLRAAGAISDVREWIIVDSQAMIVESPNTGGVHCICPHPSDLAVSKLVAWREKDRDFVQALIRHHITSVSEIEERLEEMDDETANRVRPQLRQLL
jgi:uncharacterized protein (DUF305 family)